MTTKRTLLAVIASIAVAGLVGAACGTDGQIRGRAAGDAAPMPAEGRVGSGAGAGPAPADGDLAEVPGERVAGIGAGEAGGGGLAVSVLGARIVKSASLSLQVPKGSFDARFQELTLIAGRHGGFVATSETVGGRSRSGTMVIRVPAAEFEATLADLRRLGKVTAQRISGRDVTAEHVDLQARLRNWRAQETVLLRLMQRAQSIEDSITVQRQLQEVQLAMEQIEGQLRVLDDQTEFATISLSAQESGFVPPKPDERNSLARAWERTVDAFLAVIATMMVGLGYVLPIALIALALALGRALLRRVRPRPLPAP